jgi:transmembrane sensor
LSRAQCSTMTRIWGTATCKFAQGRLATDPDRTVSFDLADGSQILLRPDSVVMLDMTEDHRLITLQRGEVVLKVHKAREVHLDVVVGEATVRAVGTIFSVKKRGFDSAEAVVQEGTVLVLERGQYPVAVTAGKIAEVDAQGVRLYQADTSKNDSHLALAAGMVSLDGKTLAEAAEEFNRYNYPKIAVDGELTHLSVGGIFPANDPNGFAAAMCVMLDIEQTVSRDPQTGMETIHLIQKKPGSNSLLTPDNRNGRAGQP